MSSASQSKAMTSMQEHERLAVVIGAGSSIGLEIARALATDHRVWIAGPLSDAEHSAAFIPRAVAREVDVTDPSSCDRLLLAAAEEGLVTVINLACFSEPAPLVAQSMGALEKARASWHRTINVGLLGAMHVLSAAGAALRGRGVRASLVSVSSINARLAVPGYAAYCAAKAGLDMLTQVAAVELAPLRVNAVAPGPVETISESLDAFPGFLDGLRKRHVLDSRLTRPADVARVVRFLVSPESDWITGQTLTVDGGVSINHGAIPSPKDLARALEGE